jgi:hypothetical protein
MTDLPVSDAPLAWPRWAARGSLIAAFVCFTMNCVFMQLTSKQPPEETRLANQIVGWSSMAVVAGGLIAGGWALTESLRRGGRETAMIAALGLLLNSGIVLLTLWMLYSIRAAPP